MHTRLAFVAMIALLVCAGCKASEQSATRDDDVQASQSESTDEESQEQAGQEQEEQGGAKAAFDETVIVESN